MLIKGKAVLNKQHKIIDSGYHCVDKAFAAPAYQMDKLEVINKWDNNGKS